MEQLGSDRVAPSSTAEARRLDSSISIQEDVLKRCLADYLESAPAAEAMALEDEYVRTCVQKELRAMGPLFSILLRMSEATEEEARKLGAGTLLEDRIGAAIRSAEIEKRLRTDALTGAASVHAYRDDVMVAMQDSIETRRTLWCVQADVDGLKRINDVFGHEVGNQVLQKITERMKRAIRRTDTLYRVGGDEFIILSDAENEHEAQIMAERLLEVVSSRAIPVETSEGRRLIQGSISIGLSVFEEPSPHMSLEERKEQMERLADQKMYQAKQAGRGRWAF